MALTKCPKCAQTVLSVASQCPKCFTEMNQSIALADKDVLADCRKCGRAVYSHIGTCPHCGTSRPAMRRRGLVIAGMIVLVIVCLTLLALLRQPSSDHVAIRGAVRPPKPVPAVPLRTVTGPLRVRPLNRLATGDTLPTRSPAETDSAISQARASLAALTGPVTPAAVELVEERAVTPGRSSAPDSGAEIKFVATWANVHGDPTSDSQIVRVLRPGTQIAVVPQPRRWWPVYENGKQVGYVSSRLLLDQPSAQ